MSCISKIKSTCHTNTYVNVNVNILQLIAFYSEITKSSIFISTLYPIIMHNDPQYEIPHLQKHCNNYI